MLHNFYHNLNNLSCFSEEGHEKDTSEADVNLDESFEDMEILEKVVDFVPEKVLIYRTLNQSTEYDNILHIKKKF